MNLKLLFNIILFFLLPLSVLAQDDSKVLRSLHTALINSSNDTVRMDIYRQFGFYFQKGKMDSSLYYHQLQLEIAKKLNFKLWEADAYQQIAYSYTWQYNLTAAFLGYSKALEIAEDPNSAEIGWGYSNFSFSKSPEEARMSIVGMIHYELSTLYNLSRSPEDERYHLMKGLEIGEKLKNYKILALVTRDIGALYLASSESDSALYYYQKALLYYHSSPYNENIGQVYQLIGSYYFSNLAYDSAKLNYNLAIEEGLKTDNLLNLTIAYYELGRLYIATNQYDSAMLYSTKGLNVAESIKSINVGDAYSQVATILKLQNRPLESLVYLERGKLLSDNINEAFINKLIQFQNIGFEEQLRIRELEAVEESYQNRLRMNGLLGSTFTLLVIAFLLIRNNRSRRKAKEKIEGAYSALKSTQSQLIQSEKMASLGELTAGIAHEIQNPLNFVNNFSEVSSELVDEMEEEIEEGNLEDVKEISAGLKQNLEKITHHGQRASSIVKGMLEHSRTGSGEKELTDINKLADEYLRLAYHGLRAKDKSFNADFTTKFDESLPKVNVVPQDIGRVLLNLINNAFQAVNGVEQPKVEVSTKLLGDKIEIGVKDNGSGIPDEIKDKIFEPFFTTKPTGQGTGLGLSMSYDIVRAHGGEIQVESEVGKGTQFIIILCI
jgi:two-component system, NtrC family, sensor kinase